MRNFASAANQTDIGGVRSQNLREQLVVVTVAARHNHHIVGRANGGIARDGAEIAKDNAGGIRKKRLAGEIRPVVKNDGGKVQPVKQRNQFLRNMPPAEHIGVPGAQHRFNKEPGWSVRQHGLPREQRFCLCVRDATGTGQLSLAAYARVRHAAAGLNAANQPSVRTGG